VSQYSVVLVTPLVMLGQVLLVLTAVAVVTGILIRLIKPDWLDRYLTLIAFTIALPISGIILVGYLAYHLIRAIAYIGWAFARPIGKSIAFAVIAVILATITAVSSFVPHVGNAVQSLSERLKRPFSSSKWAEENRFTRGMMVKIVAQEDDRTPEYEKEEQYEEKLVQVREEGKRRLAVGESALSLCIGGLLLISQVTGFSLFQTRVLGLTAAHGIQAALFLLAISILYRVSLLNFLAYTGDEEFDSIPEMDVALSYQKAVSRVLFIQILGVLLVLAMVTVNTDRELIQSVLRDYYSGNSLLGALRTGYDEWKQQNNDDEE
jgi:hypothetical protein